MLDRHNLSRWIFGLALVFLLPGAGCIKLSSTSSPAVVFETVDGGERWTAVDNVLSAPEPSMLTNQTATMFQMSPLDPSAIYLSIAKGGLFSLWNNAWFPLPERRELKAFAVDTERPCTFYGSFDGGVDKSQDCGRSWKQIFENAPSTVVTAISISPSDPSRIIMGSNRGDVFLSTDFGNIWSSPLRAGSPIAQILFHPKHPEQVFVFTATNELYRSVDGGANWLDLSAPLGELADVFRQAIVDPTTDDVLFVGTKQQLLKSSDRGEHWTALPLLTTPETTDIQTIAIDQQESRGIYYATTNTLYRSQDGGAGWQALPLPSSKSAFVLLSDPKRHGHLYVSVR
ncbi:hypothetical protein HZA86_02475 [Candidatus Uhrbacteria bacterium]|nr:hypothetical protein [Candidatus Uhrbacteria bacterium]